MSCGSTDCGLTDWVVRSVMAAICTTKPLILFGATSGIFDQISSLAKLAVSPRAQAGAPPMLLPFKAAIHSPLTPEPDVIPLGVLKDAGKACSVITPPVVMRASRWAGCKRSARYIR